MRYVKQDMPAPAIIRSLSIPNLHPMLSRLIAILTLLLAATPSGLLAQGSMSMSFFSAQDFAPTLSKGDLDVFVRVLKLKETETQAMHELYEGYAETIRRESTRVRETVYDAMDESEMFVDPGKLGPAYKAMEDWRKQAETLKRTFVDDLKTLLTKEQEQRWPIVERELRRMKLVGGRLTGEGLDVVRMVNGLKIESLSTPAEESLETYSQELDRLLLQREKFIEEHSPKFGELMDSDPKAAEQLFRDCVRIRIAIRDLNERTARSIAAELPPDASAKLLDQLAKEIGSRASIKSRAESLLKEAKELEGLTPKQMLDLDELSDWYTARLDPWKHRLASAIREDEETDMPESLLRSLGKLPPQQNTSDGYDQWRLPPEHPLVKLRIERHDLDKELRRKLMNILTPEQQDTLPPGRESYVMFNSYRPSGL